MENKLETAIDKLAQDDDIKFIVGNIEHGTKTTRGNYGKYIQYLSPYAGNAGKMYIMSEAFKRAGGDSYGIDWAKRILKGTQ